MRRAPARVADARGVVADDQHDAVAEVLELAQLLQHDRVAEVDVGRGRVDPELDAQLAPVARGGRQLGLQAALGQALDGVARQVGGVGQAAVPCGRNASVAARRGRLPPPVATEPRAARRGRRSHRA